MIDIEVSKILNMSKQEVEDIIAKDSARARLLGVEDNKCGIRITGGGALGGARIIQSKIDNIIRCEKTIYNYDNSGIEGKFTVPACVNHFYIQYTEGVIKNHYVGYKHRESKEYIDIVVDRTCLKVNTIIPKIYENMYEKDVYVELTISQAGLLWFECTITSEETNEPAFCDMFCTPSLTGGVRKLTVHDNIVFVGDYDIFDKDVAEKLIYIITGSQTRIEYSDWEGFLYVRSNGVRLSIKDKSDYKKSTQ